MDVEVFHTASRPARAVQLRAALSDVSVDLAAATTDVLNASSAAQLKHSAAIDASLQLLDMLDVTPSEAIHGIRDHLRDHVRGRVPFLPRHELGDFISSLASQPVTADIQPLIVDALKRLDPGADTRADTKDLAKALGSAQALANVPPEVILQLPASLVQAIWRSVPPRCRMDMSYLLCQYDAETAGAAKALNFGDLTAKPPPKGIREAAVLRRKSTPVSRLFTFVLGAPDLYYSACKLVVSVFEATHDPKWATLRTDLYLMHQDPEVSKGVGGPAGGPVQVAGAAGGKATGGGGPTATRDLPRDTVAQILIESERLLITDKGNVVTLVEAARRSLERKEEGGGGAGPKQPLARSVVPRTLSEQLAHVAQRLYVEAANITAIADKVTRVEISALAEFGRPVIDKFPALRQKYASAIARPMDLLTLKVNAQAGQYRTFGDMRSDVALIDTNCRVFNGDNQQVAYLFRLAKDVLKAFDALVTQEETAYRQAVDTQRVAATKGAGVGLPDLLSEPSGIMHLLLALSEPFLVRHALHVVLKGLAASARDGAPPESHADVMAALRILAVGDIANARPPVLVVGSGGVLQPSPSALMPNLSSVQFYEGVTEAVREVLGERAPALGAQAVKPAALAAGAKPVLPLPLLAALSAARTAFVEYTLVRAGTPLPALEGGPSSSMDVEGEGGGVTAALSALLSLRRGVHVHGRTVALLCLAIAVAGTDPPLPHTQAAVAYFIALARTSLPGEAGGGRVAPEACLLPTLLPALVRAVYVCHRERQKAAMLGAGRASHALLSPHALVHEVATRVVAPALQACQPSAWVRGVYHLSFALFLKTLADVPSVPQDRAWQRVIPPADALQLASGALGWAGPCESSPSLSSARAAYAPALHDLLQGGFLSPLALVWIRPDFEAPRKAYAQLVGMISPALEQPFPWGSLGLGPYVAGAGALAAGTPAGGLPLSTPTGSLGHGFESMLYTPVTPAVSAQTPASAGGGGGGVEDSPGPLGVGGGGGGGDAAPVGDGGGASHPHGVHAGRPGTGTVAQQGKGGDEIMA